MKKGKDFFPRRNHLPSLILTIVGAALLISLIAGASVFYVHRLEDTIQQETDSNLVEVAQQLSVVVDTQVEANLKNLESIALFLRTMDNMEEERIVRFIGIEARHYSYDMIFLSDEEGQCLFSDGSVGNIANGSLFYKVLDGESIVTIISHEGQNLIVYATPIYNLSGDDVIGVSGAVQNPESLRSSLEVTTFGGEGYVQLVKSDGTAIVESEHPYAVGPFDNYFDALEERGYEGVGRKSLDKLKQDMANGRTGMIGLMRGNINCRMCYMPLTTYDWYLLTVVPTSVINNKTDYFVQNTVVICAILTAIFLALIAALVCIQNSNRKKLENMAFTDEVTKGPNWRSFEIQTKEILENARSSEYVLGCLNLQKFKLINDIYGREAGDRTLRYVYDTIREVLHAGELVSRVNADYFNVLLRFTSEEEIAHRVQNFYQYLNRFNEGKIQKYWLTFTQGFFIIDDPKIKLEIIRERANIARQSRKAGVDPKMRFAFYDDGIRVSLLMEKNIENKMEMALKNGEFFVCLQPKYELSHRTVAGAEALIRWNDPEQGLIRPDQFIPVFERNGFIIQLDLFVFEEVLKNIRRWLDEEKKIVPISVNLSRSHLSDPDFLEPYIAICEKYSVSPSYIEFELTESIMFEDFDPLVSIINKIHKAGFTCSMDDFGSGYSSLNVLKEMPVDAVKLDRDFFHPGKNSDLLRGQSVIQSLVELAQKLHIKTVAEGIETMEQVDFLAKIGCDMVQGFVFAKPMTISEFEQLVYPFEGNNVEQDSTD